MKGEEQAKENLQQFDLEVDDKEIPNEWCCSSETHERYLRSILRFSPEVNEKNHIV